MKHRARKDACFMIATGIIAWRSSCFASHKQKQGTHGSAILIQAAFFLGKFLSSDDSCSILYPSTCSVWWFDDKALPVSG